MIIRVENNQREAQKNAENPDIERWKKRPTFVR